MGRGFSWKHGINHSVANATSPSPLSIVLAFSSYKHCLRVCTSISNRWLTYPPPSPLHSNGWHGIINPFSITYAFRPRLRTGLPCSDYPCAGNLGLSATGFFTRFIVTHVGILTSMRSSWPYGSPSPPMERSPTTSFRKSTASAACLSPVEFSAQGHLTSELLRFLLRMAASKPTSWLSVCPHFLFH